MLGVSKFQTAQKTLILSYFSCNETWICNMIWVNSHSMSTFTINLEKGDNSEAEGLTG